MLALYGFILLLLSFYSYVLIDPNITFFQTVWWESFRNFAVYIGYYRRDVSWFFYLVLILLLFLFHYLIVKRFNKIQPLKLALLISGLLLFSYPFLSHDFFNYLFDAKIATFYGKNPYLFKALDFPQDQWLRFMHWTHRTYPYGPIFLLISLIPSAFSLGKFILSFFFFKLTFAVFYLLAVYYLKKLDSRWAIIFATYPLVIIEGLVSSHNDLIGVSLALIGIYYFFKKKIKISWLLFLASAAVKYITLPIIFLTKNKPAFIRVTFLGLLSILVYLSLRTEVQPWYFLSLFIFLPFYERLLSRLNIFFAGLLLSYYPYIRLGGWDKIESIQLKHWIIAIFFAVNIIYLLFYYVYKDKKKFR